LSRTELKKASSLKGEITPPPDKSISHRAAIFSAISKGRSVIRNYLRAQDTISTLNAMRALGISIEEDNDVVIEGKGLYGLKEPQSVIDCGNSGTTMRLTAGLVSGNPFFSVLSGDESLRERPMGRIIKPLRQMGAHIMARDGDRHPPVAIRGGGLKGIRYEMPVASAQVKSAIILAGLYAEGETELIEPVKSRDHTERMLPSYGAALRVEGSKITVAGGRELKARDIYVPADFSSSAFFIVGALTIKGSDLKIKEVGMNPARTGLLNVLKRMGAVFEIENLKDVSGEPVGDIHIRAADRLKGADIKEDEVPSLIDEFPILCIAASLAEGVTTIRGAGELRVKETDRINAMAEGLRKMGIEVEEYKDGLAINGKDSLKGAVLESRKDHRIAMAFSIAALSAEGKTVINDSDSADVSFPGFYETLRRLTGQWAG
jgi:3-phosphoshikimate 1-carboxyvinyltransferase